MHFPSDLNCTVRSARIADIVEGELFVVTPLNDLN